ncbi:efflux RND transporter periplasmic adaptor subunit [Roseisalinus antarcticus]|uniref:Multidrug resistance protein MdtN n=1 Tax=Roseisalinus antarcticus TaxID=254357 RepID=A0A1Y5TTF3_9RHOB|nr:HlyD family efflux transporter periplasmic adaptor subunit [Roseisalinus antarcticus]SLN72107.1 multidrug resistance protein MdtN [Roseisalinus antarcticus]
MQHETVSRAESRRTGQSDPLQDISDLESPDAAAFLSAWLAMLAEDLADVRLIAVFVEDRQAGDFAPAAVHPDGRGDLTALEPVAREVLETRSPAQGQDDGGAVLIAVPVTVAGGMPAFVALQFGTPGAGVTLRQRQRIVWALGWLERRFMEQRAEETASEHAASLRAMDIFASVGAERRAPAAAQVAVNALAEDPALTRVSLGLVRGRPRRGAPVRAEAVSGKAWFRRRSATIRRLGEAMEEALDQGATVALPAGEDSQRIAVAHRAYQQETGAAAVATVVLFDDDLPVGAITAEGASADGIPPDTLRRLAALAALLGPVIELKRRQQSWIAGRAVDLAQSGLVALFGRHRPSYRLAALCLVVLAALPFAIHKPLRLVSDATLEGSRQIAAVAPFDGIIAEAGTQAGARVAEGDLLFKLDDRELELEAAKWRSDLDQLAQEERRAVSDGERGEAVLLQAQRRQGAAQLALAEARLARAEVRAPIDGIVISGDISQRIGAPISEGEEVFGIAPLESYRVVLEIDERDLDLVRPGETGSLRLTARTDAALPFEITSVTSVARIEEGRRLFRANAELLAPAESLRPGMEGVARIDAGQRSLADIWTRRLRDWVQLAIWRWMP